MKIKTHLGTIGKKTKRVIPAGDRRRMSDGKNAWRKMTPEQRRVFLDWADAERLPVAKSEPAAFAREVENAEGAPIPAREIAGQLQAAGADLFCGNGCGYHATGPADLERHLSEEHTDPGTGRAHG